MGLPTTREETFTPNTPVPSAVLNAIQDGIIAIYNSITRKRWKQYPGACVNIPATSAWVPEELVGYADFSGTGGSTGFAYQRLDYEDGDVFDVTAKVEHDVATAAMMTVELIQMPTGGLIASVASAALTGPQVLTVATGVTGVTGAAYMLVFKPGGGAAHRYIHQASYGYKRAF